MFLNKTIINESCNTSSTDAFGTKFEQTSVILWSIISPILLLIGLFGNSISFLVLSKLFRQQRSPFHLFLAVLSLNDLVVLYSGLLHYWILNLFGVNLRDQSNGSCKILLYLIYTTMQYSAWILVSVTLQRCLIVARPTKFKEMFTPKVAVIQLVIIFFILSAVNFQFFFTNGIKNGSCNSLTEAIYRFEEFVFVYVDFFILCIIPFIIMLFTNIYFMIMVKKYSVAANVTNNIIDQKIQNSIRIIMRLTWLFLATTLPISLVLIIDSYYKTADNNIMGIARTLSSLIQYAGFAFNIVLYVSVDRKFISVLQTKAKKIKTSFKLTSTRTSTKTTPTQSENESRSLQTEKLHIVL